jgi:hypothetical protein
VESTRAIWLSRLVSALLVGLPATPLLAQVVRLPVVAPTESAPPGRLVSHPDSSAELLHEPGEPMAAPASDIPPDARDGMFQKLIFDGAWLPGGGRRGMGQSDLQLRSVLALPCPTRQSPLLIVPGFAVRYFGGPVGVEMPPRLYDAYCQFRWMSRLAPRWGVDLAFTPGVFSDFEQGSDDAVRFTGHGVVAWDARPTVKLVLGVGYFDRLDVELLPVGGLIWTPHEGAKFELLFPRPRFAWRLCQSVNRFGNDAQTWTYLAAEFGGDDWAFAPTTGGTDVVNMRDYRLIVGLERKVIWGLDTRLEVAYVFGREIRYKSASPDFAPADTVMLRGGLTY